MNAGLLMPAGARSHLFAAMCAAILAVAAPVAVFADVRAAYSLAVYSSGALISPFHVLCSPDAEPYSSRAVPLGIPVLSLTDFVALSSAVVAKQAIAVAAKCVAAEPAASSPLASDGSPLLVVNATLLVDATATAGVVWLRRSLKDSADEPLTPPSGGLSGCLVDEMVGSCGCLVCDGAVYTAVGDSATPVDKGIQVLPPPILCPWYTSPLVCADAIGDGIDELGHALVPGSPWSGVVGVSVAPVCCGSPFSTFAFDFADPLEMTLTQSDRAVTLVSTTPPVCWARATSQVYSGVHGSTFELRLTFCGEHLSNVVFPLNGRLITDHLVGLIDFRIRFLLLPLEVLFGIASWTLGAERDAKSDHDNSGSLAARGACKFTFLGGESTTKVTYTSADLDAHGERLKLRGRTRERTGETTVMRCRVGSAASLPILVISIAGDGISANPGSCDVHVDLDRFISPSGELELRSSGSYWAMHSKGVLSASPLVVLGSDVFLGGGVFMTRELRNATFEAALANFSPPGVPAVGLQLQPVALTASRPASCVAASSCNAQQVLVPALNRCANPDCSALFTFSVNSYTLSCDVDYSVVGVLLMLLGLVFVVEVVSFLLSRQLKTKIQRNMSSMQKRRKS